MTDASRAPTDILVEMGRLGQKTQAGYYDYAPGDRTPRPSPVVEEIIEKVSKEYGIERRKFTDEEIVERCFLALMNVGCEVLREGVAYRASDIDVGVPVRLRLPGLSRRPDVLG